MRPSNAFSRLPGRRAFPVLNLTPLVALALLFASGCVVTQPRGEGKLERIVEPSTNRSYWRYLPKAYMAKSADERRERRWPVVVTFHGMKPFDQAHSQALEWEREADRYGFVVVAPELNAPDMLAQFPVRTVHPSFKADETAVLGVLDHVFATTQGDPANVLSTSWSSGGYMAHYMLNRHPDRFTCLAVRQSNFSSSVLDPGMTARSVDDPVLILNTENDFAVCLDESQQAREWYGKHGYHRLAWVHIRSLGHERTPDLAADFFGRVSGVEPMTPPTELSKRQAIAGNDEGIAFLTGRMGLARSGGAALASNSQEDTVAASTSGAGSSGASALKASPARAPNKLVTPANDNRVATKATPTRPNPAPAAPLPARSAPPTFSRAASEPSPGMTTRSLPSGPELASARQSPPRSVPQNRPTAKPMQGNETQTQATPSRSDAVPTRDVPRKDPLGIRVSSAIGIDPLHLNFSAECPAEWYNSASFLWTIGGETVGTGVNGQKTIVQSGEHLLSLLVVTADGAEHRTSRTIRVIPRLATATKSN